MVLVKNPAHTQVLTLNPDPSALGPAPSKSSCRMSNVGNFGRDRDQENEDADDEQDNLQAWHHALCLRAGAAGVRLCHSLFRTGNWHPLHTLSDERGVTEPASALRSSGNHIRNLFTRDC